MMPLPAEPELLTEFTIPGQPASDLTRAHFARHRLEVERRVGQPHAHPRGGSHA